MSCDYQETVDLSVLQSGHVCEQLTLIALDMNVALGHTEGIARVRLERAIRGIDHTIREVRLLAAGQPSLGRWGADRWPA